MNRKDRRIVPITKLTGFRVAPGDPDPRGWDVVAADGRTVGVVRDLLVDREAMRVRYLEVELAEGGRRTLLPVGTALLDDTTDRVLFHGLASQQLAQLPEYDYDTFSREYETSVLTRFGAGGGGAATSAAWSYESRHFDDDAFFRKRRNRYAGMARGERLDDKLTRSEEVILSRRVVGPADAGRAAPPAAERPHAESAAETPAKKRSRRATKSAAEPETAPAEPAATRPAARTTTRAAKPTTRTRGAYEAPEPDTAPAAADASAVRETDEEIVVPIVEEQLVVERRPVVKEEIVIKKKAVRETRTVEADLRKERVDVERHSTRDPDAGGP